MMQMVWMTLLAAHIGAAGMWWWMMPGGYPSSAPEFWMNQVAPPLIGGVLLTALFLRGRIGQALLPLVLVAIPVFWMAFGISARLTFVESFASAWNLPFILGAALVGLWVRQFRSRLKPLVPVLAIVACAAVAGWKFPGALRADEPSTQPAGGTVGAPPGGAGDHKMVKMSKDAQMRPGDARLVVKRDAMVLNVQPLLSFADRSPDRFWVSMAPEGRSPATTRSMTGRGHDGAATTLFYKDEGESELDVSASGGAVQLDGRSKLAQPIYSHGNSYAELAVTGHKKLSVSFSPAPQQRVEVAAVGAPMRFGYLDGNDTFHVVQASDRTRGPYQELATGKLKRGEPLTVTLYDGDKAMFAVTLADWAAQVSTALSPTAGDGLPDNAIELARGGEAPTAPALVTFTLAATTVGRGTQTVGHAPGVYRDRIAVRLP